MGRLLRPDHDILLAAHAPEGSLTLDSALQNQLYQHSMTLHIRSHHLNAAPEVLYCGSCSRDVLTTQACLGAYCRGLSGPQHLPLWYLPSGHGLGL